MTRLLSIVLTGSAVGAGSFVAAHDRPISTVTKTQAQLAATLAKLIYPEALNSAIVTYTIDHVISRAYHADPSLQKLETERPGIIDAMIAAMKPAFQRGRREALPRLWAKTGAVYAASLTSNELQRAIQFYSSPAGRRLAVADQDAAADASSNRNRGAARPAQLDGTNPDHARMTTAFQATVTGQRLASLRPQIEAIVNAWSNASTPDADARVEEAMLKAADRFYDSAPEPIRLTPTVGLQPRGGGSPE